MTNPGALALAQSGKKGALNLMSWFVQRASDFDRTDRNDREMRTFRVFSKREMREVSLLRDVQHYLSACMIWEGNYHRFLELTALINNLFPDKIIHIHNSRVLSFYRDIGPKFCPKLEKKSGFERDAAKFHSVFEILKLKFDHRTNESAAMFLLPRADLSKFVEVHEEALAAERMLYLSKAKEMVLPLTLNALQFFDAGHDPWTFGFYLTLWEEEGERVLADLIHSQPLPKMQELKDMVRFMKESGSWQSFETSPEPFIWRKFFLMELSKSRLVKEGPLLNVSLMLLALLEKEGKLVELEPESLLALLKKFLMNLQYANRKDDNQGAVYTFTYLGKELDIPFSKEAMAALLQEPSSSSSGKGEWVLNFYNLLAAELDTL